MIIMPSTPRLSTPARSVTSSPSAAMPSGVAGVMTVRRIASTLSGPPFRGFGAGGDQPDAVMDQGVAGEDEKEQQALEDAADLVGNADRQLRGLAAEIGQRQHEAGCDNAERVQTAEKGDDDGGEAVARGDGRLDMADRARNFGYSRKAGKRAGMQHREPHHPLCRKTNEPPSPPPERNQN